jgi:hypothetical protein
MAHMQSGDARATRTPYAIARFKSPHAHPTHAQLLLLVAMSVGGVAQHQVVLVRSSIVYLTLFQRFIDASGWGVLLG